MSIRGRSWLAGSALGMAGSACLAIDPTTRPFAIPVGLIVLPLAGLIGEWIALRRPDPGRRVGPAHDPSPADGVVGILPLPGLDGPANRADGRWRSYLPSGVLNRSDERSSRSKSPPTLLGKIAVFSIFVGMDGRSWSDDEIAGAHRALERAGTWLEREAIRHQAPVHIDLAEVYFRAEEANDDPVELDFVAEGDDVGPLEANAGTKYLAMASRTAAKLGFSDVADLQVTVNGLAAADRTVWVLHLLRAGRSIAIPAATSDLDGVGLAVCFARESSFPEPLAGPGRVDPTTVVHELLHLFGASDKYGAPIRSFPPQTVSSAEIMRLDFDHLHRMRVDRLTADEIGWPTTPVPGRGEQEARRRSGRPPAG